jgi:anti-sigma factor RsiW
MECRETQTLLHGYVDGELDLVRSLEIERHLETCPDCAQVCKNLRTIQSALHSASFYRTAPPGLSARVRSAVHRETRPRFFVPRLTRTVLSLAAAAAVLVFAIWFLPRIVPTSGNDTIDREIIAAHVRSLMVNHLADVVSTDRHTVKPWFNGKLDFSPPVMDLKDQGFPLIGGRLDYLDGRPVAALVYRRQKHTINLFIWPESGSHETQPEAGLNDKAAVHPRELSRQGYQIDSWNQAGMHFWAVSDLNAAELQEFARRIGDAVRGPSVVPR